MSPNHVNYKQNETSSPSTWRGTLQGPFAKRTPTAEDCLGNITNTCCKSSGMCTLFLQAKTTRKPRTVVWMIYTEQHRNPESDIPECHIFQIQTHIVGLGQNMDNKDFNFAVGKCDYFYEICHRSCTGVHEVSWWFWWSKDWESASWCFDTCHCSRNSAGFNDHPALVRLYVWCKRTTLLRIWLVLC